MLFGANITARIATTLVAMVMVAGLAAPTSAQDKKKAPAAQQPAKPKVPKPEDFTVQTADVELHCTYYPSTKGKEAVPVILVHPLGGRRTELDGLAKQLQEQGDHAVIVPDLRGHGDSNIRKIPGRDSIEITPEDLNAADLARMATSDFVLLKNELIGRHNAGEFNIDLLTLVGVELGSNLALHWAAVDWSQPTVTVRLGRDVKALVLVSPLSTYKSLRTSPPGGALGHPAVRAGLSLMVMGGVNDPKMKQELARVNNAVSRYHPEPTKLASESEEDFERRYYLKKDYFLREKPTTLQGMELLKAPNMKAATDILGFIKLRLVDQLVEKNLPAWEGERRKDPVP